MGDEEDFLPVRVPQRDIVGGLGCGGENASHVMKKLKLSHLVTRRLKAKNL